MRKELQSRIKNRDKTKTRRPYLIKLQPFNHQIKAQSHNHIGF